MTSQPINKSASNSSYGTAGTGTTPTGWEENEIVRGNNPTPQQVASKIRFDNAAAQVNEVVGIMKNNMNSVLEKDGKLTELDKRGEILADRANEFQTGTSKLRGKQCIQFYKIQIIVGIAILIALVLMALFIWG